MRIALGHEHDPLPPWVLPVERVLAGIRATSTQHLVGGSRARTSARAIATYEHHRRRGLGPTAVALGVHRPARQEMIITLKLAGDSRTRQPVLALNHQVDRRRPLGAAGNLDCGIGTKCLELLRVQPLA